MCGIAGIYSSDIRVARSLGAACQQMLNTLVHRGPDAQSVYQSGKLVLGHRRLSIIDLSQAAKQPLSNEDDTVWLACNGEIYNYRELREELKTKGHRFKSQTDSEVILHLYEEHGTSCLNRLRGMFAFALWDEKASRLFLARDRFGIKPLYYSNLGGDLLFASEARAILASRLVSDKHEDQAFLQFLQYGSIPSPSTVFKDVRSLAAGHFLLHDDSGARIQKYWDLSECLKEAGEGQIDIYKVRERLSDTICRHLASDVPLGISLSGGVDSSTLAAFASQGAKSTVHTLTAAFHEGLYDESTAARFVSERFGTCHHELKVDGHMIGDILPAFFHAMDQPTVDGLNTYVVAQAAREAGLRVLLSGLGGDELFAGYPHFRHVELLFRSLPILRQIPKPMRLWILQGLAQAASRAGFYGANRLHYLKDPSLASAYRVYRGLFPPRTVQALLQCDEGAIEPAPTCGVEQLASDLDRALYLEFGRYLHDQLLRDTDVMSMCHSVEVRVPFLDHELVEGILRIASHERFHPRVSKFLLKKMVEGVLPEAIVNHPKQGFTFPLADWMRSSLKSHIEEVLLDQGDATTFSLLNRKAIRQVWKRFLCGELHWSQPWALFVLKRWQECHSSFSSTHEACHPEPFARHSATLKGCFAE